MDSGTVMSLRTEMGDEELFCLWQADISPRNLNLAGPQRLQLLRKVTQPECPECHKGKKSLVI